MSPSAVNGMGTGVRVVGLGEFYTSRPLKKEFCTLYFRHPAVTLKKEGVIQTVNQNTLQHF